MEKPRFYFRLSETDLLELKNRARAAKQTPSEFARTALFSEASGKPRIGENRSNGEDAETRFDPQTEELLNRLAALEQSVSKSQAAYGEAIESIARLCMASVASSALLSDDGKSSNDVARKQILDHIEEAMKIAPGLLKIHGK